jgi:hypothetical protein
MTSSSKVIPLHPYNTIEIDDTRLQAMWRSHDRRQGMLFGVLGLAGVAAILLGVATVVWAAMSRQPAPQVKVDVQPPNVTVNVPEPPPPVINITVPPALAPQQLPQAPPPAADEGKVVTEYAIFKDVMLGDRIKVQTTWNYRSSIDKLPYNQECHAFIGATGYIQLAVNGQPWKFLAKDARALNLPEAQAQALVKECQWHPA